MKNTLLIVVFALVASYTLAQKPSAGKRTAEVNLNFQIGTAPIAYDLPELRLRYFLTNKSAIRVRFGMQSTTEKSSVTNGIIISDITDKSGFGFSIMPGYEMHFEGTRKLSPYAGAQIGVMLDGKSSREVTNSSNPNPLPSSIIADNSYKKTGGSSITISAGLLMGADYYISDGVFVGGEFGLGLFGMTLVGEGKTVTLDKGVETITKSTKSSTLELFGVTTGGVRLGFVF